MATTTSSPPALPLTAAPITSIQPGGGLCMSLELAWGRCRRAWLRTCRPGYVRRMQERRQGHCPGCTHDIIDSRDLKFYRNVCGYSFRPEDDPFAWRGRLRLARAGLAEIIVFSAVFLAASLALGHLAFWYHPLFYAPLAVVLVLWGFVFSFFRDPERVIPPAADILVSPADGVVTHVGEAEDPDFPGGRAYVVSIFLSVFNVHVNRLPCSGRVAAVRYYPGEYLDARLGECRKRNEQLWIDMDERATGCRLRIKQIAGAVARRIVCWLKEGEEVHKGERLGMIKFGSRTEVLLPVDAVAEALVKVGEMVRGGSTSLLRLRPAAREGNGLSASAPARG